MSSASDCSVSSSYSVVTSDTTVHAGSKVSMNSRLLPTKNNDVLTPINEDHISMESISESDIV